MHRGVTEHGWPREAPANQAQLPTYLPLVLLSLPCSPHSLFFRPSNSHQDSAHQERRHSLNGGCFVGVLTVHETTAHCPVDPSPTNVRRLLSSLTRGLEGGSPGTLICQRASIEFPAPRQMAESSSFKPTTSSSNVKPPALPVAHPDSSNPTTSTASATAPTNHPPAKPSPAKPSPANDFAGLALDATAEQAGSASPAPKTGAPHTHALAATAEKFSREDHSKTLPGQLDTPSAPIDIPTSKNPFNAATVFSPATPLTARDRGHDFFPWHPKSADRRIPGLAPRRRQERAVNHFSDDSASPSSSVGSTFSMHRERPSSPLSPASATPLAPTSPVRQSGNPKALQPTTRSAPKLRLNALPRFHPANFESPSSSGTNTPRQNQRPGSTAIGPHQRHYPGVQQKIQQYQRDVIAASAQRAATLAASPSAAGRPTSPRLEPVMGSPGPVTPLMLEPSDDYLTAGSLSSPMSKPDRGRELVQRLVDKENERRRYSGRSESLSPAVSPAGGRG